MKYLLFALLMVFGTHSHSASMSSICTQLPVPDMSRFNLKMMMNQAYDDASLGRGVTYQDGDGGPGTILVSIYMFDGGEKTISDEFEDTMLRSAYQNIVSMKSDRQFDQAYMIPEIVFKDMGGFLSRGIYLYALNPNNTKSPLPEMHLVSIGQYKDCVMKVRATLQTSSFEDEDRADSLRLFRGISRRLQQQVQGDDWNGPKN